MLCRNPNGELRVDLTVPGAEARLTYDTESVPSLAQIGVNARTKVIPATLTISSLSSLSGPPTAIHIHGSAGRGAQGPPLVTLCSDNCPSALLPTGSYEFSISLPIGLVVSRSTYINVHTQASPGGEIRGQIAPLDNSYSKESYVCAEQLDLCVLGVAADVLQEGATMTRSYTANAQQEIPPGPSTATAAFTVTFHRNNGTVTFSSIATFGLSDLSAVHIHGPCKNVETSGSPPCNADVVYTICGGTFSSCPSGSNPTIPGFNVDSAQNSPADGSLLLGLMAAMLSGRDSQSGFTGQLFYVNFHTAA